MESGEPFPSAGGCGLLPGGHGASDGKRSSDGRKNAYGRKNTHGKEGSPGRTGRKTEDGRGFFCVPSVVRGSAGPVLGGAVSLFDGQPDPGGCRGLLRGVCSALVRGGRLDAPFAKGTEGRGAEAERSPFDAGRTGAQEERYREQEQAEEEIRALRHDMRNSYLLLHGLLEQNRKEEALAWLEKESGALSGVPEHIRTQSGAVSAVLNGKLNLARREGISVSCRIAASLAGIEERDLCRLLGNLLDNALEAARKTQNGTMDLILCGGEGYLQIDLENASAKPLLLTDGRARTDKEDPKSHGRGLRIVRQIVEKYDGMMRVENREGSVTVRVVLFRKGKV